MNDLVDGVSADSGYGRDEFAGKITPLRQAEDRQRAELITGVVDASARLHSSVKRFVVMLALDVGADMLVDTTNPQSLVTLLSLLGTLAGKAKFERLRELNRVIERATQAGAHRDVLFLQSPVAGEAALRSAAAELERLDAAFIGLCVEHVLASQARVARRCPRRLDTTIG